jgi:hypothetical protein
MICRLSVSLRFEMNFLTNIIKKLYERKKTKSVLHLTGYMCFLYNCKNLGRFFHLFHAKSYQDFFIDLSDASVSANILISKLDSLP